MKTRIAFISEHASPLAVLGGADGGGQNVYVSELSAQLVKRGYLVDVYTRWEDPKGICILLSVVSRRDVRYFILIVGYESYLYRIPFEPY